MVEISDIHCFSLSDKNESAPLGNSLRTSSILALFLLDCSSLSFLDSLIELVNGSSWVSSAISI